MSNRPNRRFGCSRVHHSLYLPYPEFLLALWYLVITEYHVFLLHIAKPNLIPSMDWQVVVDRRPNRWSVFGMLVDFPHCLPPAPVLINYPLHFESLRMRSIQLEFDINPLSGVVVTLRAFVTSIRFIEFGHSTGRQVAQLLFALFYICHKLPSFPAFLEPKWS